MKTTKFKRSVVFPIVLLVYLAAMAYLGRGQYYAGEYLSYFGIIGACLLIIVALYFVLRKKEQLRDRQMSELEDETGYTTYAQEEDAQSANHNDVENKE